MKLPIDPEVDPGNLGPLMQATQQTVLNQLQERLKVLNSQASLRQQQTDRANDILHNPIAETKFSEGDLVMVKVFVKENVFAPRWHGPYQVKAVCNNCLAVQTRGKMRWYHMAQCKTFRGSNP